MKRILSYLSLLAVTMFLLPCLTVEFGGDGGMAIVFLLFYVFNPILAAFVGIYAGMDMKTTWYFPLLLAVCFLPGVWVAFTTTEIMFVIYSICYLIIGWVVMLITYGIRKLLKK